MSESIIPSGVITIERPWRWCWGARTFAVWIDERKFGHIKAGETKEFYLEPGIHTVSIHIDMTKTAPLSVVVNESRPCVILCEPIDPWKLMTTPRIWFKFSQHLQVTLKSN